MLSLVPKAEEQLVSSSLASLSTRVLTSEGWLSFEAVHFPNNLFIVPTEGLGFYS